MTFRSQTNHLHYTRGCDHPPKLKTPSWSRMRVCHYTPGPKRPLDGERCMILHISVLPASRTLLHNTSTPPIFTPVAHCLLYTFEIVPVGTYKKKNLCSQSLTSKVLRASRPKVPSFCVAVLRPLQYKTPVCLHHLFATVFLARSNRVKRKQHLPAQLPAAMQHHAAVVQQAYRFFFLSVWGVGGWGRGCPYRKCVNARHPATSQS